MKTENISKLVVGGIMAVAVIAMLWNLSPACGVLGGVGGTLLTLRSL